MADDCAGIRRLRATVLVLGALLVTHRPLVQCEEFYGDPNAVLVELGGRVVDRLPAKRIALAYPELRGRAEVNAALDSAGTLWAAVGYSVGTHHQPPVGVERLFCSTDGGRTWTSRPLPMTENRNFLAFTVLADDALLLVAGVAPDDPSWRKRVTVYRSSDRGETWATTCEIRCEPFEHVGEGFLSMTQLNDGTILFPVARWTDRPEGRTLEHGVFASSDQGASFPAVHPTFADCCEAHVIQLRSGRLVGAFRYQRPPHPGETPEQIRALGGDPDWSHPTSGKRAKSAFKHVFVGESDDNGRTWKSLRALRDREGQALLEFGETHGQLVEAHDGRVVLVHDRRYPYEEAHTRARVSQDEGRTWEPEIYHISQGMGYPASVALPDGTLVTLTGSTRLDQSFRPIGGWRVQAVRWKLPPREGTGP